MRWPPATEIAVPVVIVPPIAPAPTSTAAPERVMRAVASRAASGSSRMRSPSMTSETAMARSSTWSCDAPPRTSTVSASSPVSSVGSITKFAPTCSTMSDCAKVRKPCSAACRR